ncbi:MAG: hypothetical protein R2819_05795 [Allomuricauda sp.]
MDKVLYVVPDLEKVSGGPRTRISMFKAVFLEHGDSVIEGKGKLLKSFKVKKGLKVYVESATNRVSFTDLLSLLYLKCISKEVVIFIRDIYIELFPHEYASFRGRITMFFNKASNFFLSLISTKMAFPTKDMGRIFFKKNTWFPKRRYFALPPGCAGNGSGGTKVDFSKRLGILYLGSVSYTNAGFDYFLEFAGKNKEEYGFFVLSGDRKAAEMTKDSDHIMVDRIEHSKIADYIADNNIFLGFHSRPRNEYDDITFPIKALDFIGFQLPFVTERHKPIYELLGKEYELYAQISNCGDVSKTIQKIKNVEKYSKIKANIKEVALKNSYAERYKSIF